MKKKKIYIFVMHDIRSIGGAEMYVIGKARYLKKVGWNVHTFCYTSKRNANFPSLGDCMTVTDGFGFLSIPPYRLKRYEQDFFLDLMIQKLKIKLRKLNEYELLIESITSPPNYWGELLAYKLGARHFVTLLEEHFRYPMSHHEENLDFFYFKLQRNELLAGETSLQDLFNGYKNVKCLLQEIPNTIREQDPVQDIKNAKVDAIQKADWNICHFGRSEKNYVPYFMDGVAELARRHVDKKINFIFLGNTKFRKNLINQTFENIPNVNLIFLGVLAPIPRSLFSKVDVVCAISQSARFSADENVLTIVASASNFDKTPGVLGYDTLEQVYGEPTFGYCEILENVLVKRLYDDKVNTLPKLEPAEKYYEKFWDIVKIFDPTQEYFFERLSRDRIRHWVAVFPFSSIARGAKIILFGATEIATDYRRQIASQYQGNLMDFGHVGNDAKDQSQVQIEIGPDGIKKIENAPYCHILATVDEHHKNFDKSVVGLSRLKKMDYDAIVITTYTKDAEKARKKILKTVPQMADRIICNLQFVEVYWEHPKQTPYIYL